MNETSPAETSGDPDSTASPDEEPASEGSEVLEENSDLGEVESTDSDSAEDSVDGQTDTGTATDATTEEGTVTDETPTEEITPEETPVEEPTIIENSEASISEAAKDEAASFFEYDNDIEVNGNVTVGLELNEEVPVNPGQFAFKLADVNFSGVSEGDALPFGAAMEALFANQFNDQDLQLWVLDYLLDSRSAQITTALTENSAFAEALAAANNSFIPLFEGWQASGALEDTLNLSLQQKRALLNSLNQNADLSIHLTTLLTSELRAALVNGLALAAEDGMVTEEEKDAILYANLEPLFAGIGEEASLTPVLAAFTDSATQTELFGLVADSPALEELESPIAVKASTDVANSASTKAISSEFTFATDDISFLAGSVVVVIEPQRTFTPGLYTLEITLTNPLTGETQVYTQDFA